MPSRRLAAVTEGQGRTPELRTLQAAVLAAAASGHEQAAWLLADGLRPWRHARGAVSAWHAVATAALAAAEQAGDDSAQAAAHPSIPRARTWSARRRARARTCRAR